jgi:hypothetical protein
VSVVSVDLFEVTSMVDVALRLDAALASSRGRFAELARRLAASLEVSLGGVKLTFARPARPDPLATVHVLLDVLVESSSATPTVVLFDEFSSITTVGGVAGLFRTKLQHHFDRIGLLFAGSLPSTMRTLFSEREQPFYGQADLITIDPLSASTVHDLVTRGFADNDRDPGLLDSHMYRFCRGHPRRTMQVADHAWELAEPGVPYTDALWARTVAEVEAATDDANETFFAGFSDAEKKALRVLASGGSVYGRAAELAGLHPSSARRSLTSLTDAGVLVEGALVDPLFAHWLRGRLPI